MNRSLIIFVLTFVLPYTLLFDENSIYALVFPLFFTVIWNSQGQITLTYPLDIQSIGVWVQMTLLFGVPYLVLCLIAAWQINRVESRDTEHHRGVLTVLVGIIILVGYFLAFTLLSLQFVTIYHGAIGPIPILLTPIFSLFLLKKQNTLKTNTH